MSDQKGPAVKLPWTRVLDQNSSCFYLFNTKTGESIWETPTIIQGINEGLTPTQAKRRADAAKAAGSSNGSASPAAAPPTTAATATTTTTTASSAPSTSAETLTEEDIALGIDARVEHTPLSDSEGEASPAGRPGGGLAIDTDADGVAELVARDMEAARSAPSRSFKGHRSSIAVTMMSRSGGAYVQPAASPSAAHLPAHLRSPPRTSGGGATGSPAVEVTNVAAGVTRTGSASPRSATSPPSAAGVGSGAAAGAGTGTDDIRVQFKEAPGSAVMMGRECPRNELVMSLQPKEAICMKTNIKSPGFSSLPIQSQMSINYHDCFDMTDGNNGPDAYTRLILDVLRGKQGSFVRDDELRRSWEIFTPVLKQIEDENVKPLIYKYGSRGPDELTQFIEDKGGFILGEDASSDNLHMKRDMMTSAL